MCLLADWGFTRAIVLHDENSESGRIQHLLLLNSNELPVFGTSMVHGLDLGTNAFNYGLDGTSLAATEVLLDIELAKPKTTPLVVELQFQDTGRLGEQGKFIPFATDPRFRQLLKRFHAWEWRYSVPGFRYFGYYDWFIKDYLSERAQVTPVTRGFVQNLHVALFDQASFDNLVRERLQKTNGFFPDEELNRRLVGLIAAHPQRLFFLVATPLHASYYAHFQNDDKLKAFEAELASFPNVVVIDWSRLPYPDQEFVDTQHLRIDATAELSRKLRKKIAQVLQERKQPALVVPADN
jgi:hypothetical protein